MRRFKTNLNLDTVELDGLDDGGTGFGLDFDAGASLLDLATPDRKAHDSMNVDRMDVDIPGDTTTTATVAVDGSVTGVVDTRGDRDWFGIELVEGESYLFTLDGATVGSVRGLFNPFLSIYDSTGTFLAGDSDSGPGRDSLLQFVATESGTFFLEARAESTFSTGGYNLSVRQDDHGDTFATATDFARPGNASTLELAGTLADSSDIDVFSVFVSAGEFIAFETLSDLNLSIVTSSGVALATGTGNGGTLGYTAVSSTTYYLRVEAPDGTAVTDLDYTLSVTSGDEVGGRSVGTAEAISIDAPVVGRHDYDTDRDVFTFTAEAGFEGRFTISDAATLRLRDVDGAMVATSDAGAQEFTYTFDAEGIYFVEVLSTDGTSVLDGDYTLSFSGANDDILAGQTRDLAVGATTTAAINYMGDRDQFSVDATAGQLVRFVTEATSGFLGVLADGTRITSLIGGDGVVELQGGSGWEEFFLASGDSGLDYSVEALLVTDDDFAGNQTTTGRVDIGTTISVSVDYDGDADAFQFEGEFGEAVEFTAQGARIVLYTLAGDLVAVGTNAVTFLADMDGTYVVRVVGDTAGTVSLQSDTRTIDILGSQGRDVLTGTDDADLVSLLGGSDRFNGEAGNDIVYGGSGSDTISGGLGDDTLYGGADRDFLNGDDGNDRLLGGDGSDFLNGNEGDDALNSGDGNDFAYGGTGNDRISGNDGDDFLSGEAGDDILSGGNGFDRIFGGAGEDTLTGGAGEDLLYGGDDNDRLLGNDGEDELFGQLGDDVLLGGNGSDRAFGGAGDDTVDGGAGRDILNGNEGNDRVLGGDDEDLVIGADGDDQLFGQGGNDRLIGGEGADSLFGGEGRDVLIGGAGEDRVLGGDDVDIVIGADGDDQLFGQAGNDRLIGGEGADSLSGGEGRDVLIGGAGDDDISGGADVDYIVAGDGNDVLRGGEGSDRLIGNAGDDTLISDLGRNLLIGGEGADRFVAEAGAELTFVLDWEATDQLDLSDFGVELDAVDVRDVGGDARVYVDGDLVVVVTNTDAAELDAADFIL